MEGYPELKLDHLRRITDCTGIIQHSIYSLPDRETGYTTDDNARALVVALRLLEMGFETDVVLPLAEIYLGFLRHAQKQRGTFHNYMSYNRSFADDEGSEDCFGRAVWACGCAARRRAGDGLGPTARLMLERAIPRLDELQAVRARAYAILGLSAYLQSYPNEGVVRSRIEALSAGLVKALERASRGRWQWFEDRLTYSNAILPGALFRAYAATQRGLWLEAAETSLGFLSRVLWRKDFVKLVGNQGWYLKGKTPAEYDEQPVDAGYLVQAYAWAYLATRKDEYLERARGAYEWFHGRNINRVPVYEELTGGCYDGLTPDGVNLNQGAESLLAFLLARLALQECQVAREGVAA